MRLLFEREHLKNKMTLMDDVIACIEDITDENLITSRDVPGGIFIFVNYDLYCQFNDPDKCIITNMNDDDVDDNNHEITGSAFEIASGIIEVALRNPNLDIEYSRQVSEKLKDFGVRHDYYGCGVSSYGITARGTKLRIFGNWKKTNFTTDEMAEYIKNYSEKFIRFRKELDETMKQSGFRKTTGLSNFYEKMGKLFEVIVEHDPDLSAFVCRVQYTRRSVGEPDVIHNESLTPEEIVARINSYLSQ